MKTAKVLLKTLGVLIIFLMAAAVIFVWTFDVNQYKAILEKKVSEAIGQKVDIGSIGWNFSAKDGLKLGLKNLDIKQAMVDQAGVLFKAQSIDLGIDVLRFLKSREIVIFNVLIDKPMVFIFKSKDGSLNVNEMTKTASSPSVGGPNKEYADEGLKGENSHKEAYPVLIKTIKIVNGQINYTDNSLDPVSRVQVKDISFSANDFSFLKPFNFEFKANLYHKEPNIFVKGVLKINEDFTSMHLSNANVTTNLVNFNYKEIAEKFPVFEPLTALTVKSGTIKLNINVLSVLLDKMEALDCDGRLEDGAFKYQGLPRDVDGVSVELKADQGKISINKFEGFYGSGKVEVTVVVDDYLNSPKEAFSVSLHHLEMKDILDIITSPVEIQGYIEAYIDGSMVGYDFSRPKDSLTAKGKVELKEGIIKDVNVLKLVVDKISFIPNLAKRLDEKMPPSYKKKFQVKDTALKQAEGEINVEGDKVYFKEGRIDADGFLLSMEGNIDFEQNLTCLSSITLPIELSQVMIASVDELSAFVLPNNRIYIPFKPYAGKASQYVPYPDDKGMVKKVIQSKGREELEKVIFKALDIEKDKPADQSVQPIESTGQPVSPEPKKPEQQAVENILDLIFK